MEWLMGVAAVGSTLSVALTFGLIVHIVTDFGKSGLGAFNGRLRSITNEKSKG